MKPETFEATLKKTPFRPFRIHADGRTFAVDHPEQVWIFPNKESVIIVPPEGGFHIIDMDHISSLSGVSRSASRTKPAT